MGSNNFDDKGAMELVRNIMIMSIVALFVVIFCVIVVYFCPKRRHQATEDTGSRVCEERGLDASFLKTIRVIQFDRESFKEGLECAICLSEVKDGEKIRVLPTCDHGFHVECVDMWLHSHSTCPTCRKPIVDQSEMPIDQQESITVLFEVQEANNHHLGSNLEQA